MFANGGRSRNDQFLNSFMRINELTRPQKSNHAANILHDAGYKVLGRGSFGSVFEKPGANYVLKLFEEYDVAYRSFIDLVRRFPNPHFPKFYGKLVRVSDEYYAIRMEKLDPYRGNEEMIRVYIMNRDYKPDKRDLHRQFYLDILDAKDFMEENPSLKEACGLIIDHLAPHFRIDIKQDNLMVRGKTTIVITDPVVGSTEKKINWSVDPKAPVVTNYTRRRPEQPNQKSTIGWTPEDDELLRQLMVMPKKEPSETYSS